MPRWQIGLFWRTDGEPLWRDGRCWPTRGPNRRTPRSTPTPRAVLSSVAANLGLPLTQVPGYEDAPEPAGRRPAGAGRRP